MTKKKTFPHVPPVVSIQSDSFCFTCLNLKSLTFLPPAQHSGGEWNVVCAAQRIEFITLDNVQTSQSTVITGTTFHQGNLP